MSELEERISAILNDSEQMEKITAMAQKLMGASGGELDGVPLPGELSRLMGGADDDKTALLEAMKPYLSEKRRVKMDKAIKVARIARLARFAMNEGSGEGGA